MARTYRVSYDQRQANARDKAKTRLDLITFDKSTMRWRIESASSPDGEYLVSTIGALTCNCPAGKAELPCWHVEGVRMHQAENKRLKLPDNTDPIERYARG